jgi:hypothetical protein
MSSGEPPDRPREATLADHTHPPFMRLVGWLPRKDAAAELLTLNQTYHGKLLCDGSV